jgi:hypothetical protein
LKGWVRVRGPEFPVYNVHSLVHICDDAALFGPLDKISCFPFENFLHRIKKSIRSSFLPFNQVIGRLIEMNKLKVTLPAKHPTLCRKDHYHGPVVDGYTTWKQYAVVETSDFILKLSSKDNCVVTCNEAVGIVRNILFDNSNVMLVLSVYQNVTSLYEYPMSSSHIDVYSVSQLQDSLTVVPLNNIICKAVRLPIDATSYGVIPLNHFSSS